MYLLHINDQGKIGLFQLHGNGTFTLDNLDEYQKLVKWNQQNMRPPLNLDLPFPPKSKIFFDSLPLVQYCKNAGLMLHAKEGGFTLGGIDARDAAPRLIRLNFAWTRLRDSRERKTASGLVRHESNLLVPEPVWNGLNVTLKEESSEVRRISSLTITRSFIYIDISDFSKYKPGEQALIINSLAGAVNAPDLWQTRRNVGIEAMLCIGDGYIFVFSSPITGTFFAAYLAQLIEIMVANRDLPVDFHFRIGVHAGPVYTFWDPGRAGGWNYIGEGINGGRRVLDAVGKKQDDVVFISGQVRQMIFDLQKNWPEAPNLLANLSNRGRKLDKHGKPWRVYELNHTALCGPEMPPKYRRAPNAV